MKVITSNFGIENHAACGFDKLHIRSYDDKAYGRLCSSKANSKLPFNGMASGETFGGIKLKSKVFREWLLLDTDHLVIGFDSDSEQNFAGFELKYEIIEPEITDPFVGPLELVIDDMEDQLLKYIHEITSLAPHAERLETRLLKMLGKFDNRMRICRNGDQSGIVHTGLPTVIFDPNEIMGVKDAWLVFFKQAFENCDLWIMREADNNFDDTNWPKRIKSWFINLARDLDQIITRK